MIIFTITLPRQIIFFLLDKHSNFYALFTKKLKQTVPSDSGQSLECGSRRAFEDNIESLKAAQECLCGGEGWRRKYAKLSFEHTAMYLTCQVHVALEGPRIYNEICALRFLLKFPRGDSLINPFGKIFSDVNQKRN